MMVFRISAESEKKAAVSASSKVTATLQSKNDLLKKEIAALKEQAGSAGQSDEDVHKLKGQLQKMKDNFKA